MTGPERERQALQWIGTVCESFTVGRCWDNGRSPAAPLLADRWCPGCIAAWGLGVDDDALENLIAGAIWGQMEDGNTDWTAVTLARAVLAALAGDPS